MKIPERLKIGGRDYKIIYPHRFTDSCQVLNGQHDWSGQTIKISDIDAFGSQRHPQGIAHTLLHEILHGVDMVYTCGTLFEMKQAGEDLIEQLAEGLLQVIRDNDLDFRAEKV